MHGNIRMGTGHHGHSSTGTSHHGNARERWMGTPIQRGVVCYESFFSVSHEEYETTEEACSFNCLIIQEITAEISQPVKNEKTRADEIVPEPRLEKPMSWSLPDYLKTAGTTLILETKNTRSPATTHITHAYRVKPHDTVPPVSYTICGNSTSAVQKQ